MRFCSDSVGSTSHDDGRLLTLLPAASSSTRQVDPFLSLPPDVHSCILATGLDAASLSRLEASCRHFMIAIGDSASVWLTVGRQMFFGVEVDQGRDFSAFQATDGLDGEAAMAALLAGSGRRVFERSSSVRLPSTMLALSSRFRVATSAWTCLRRAPLMDFTSRLKHVVRSQGSCLELAAVVWT